MNPFDLTLEDYENAMYGHLINPCDEPEPEEEDEEEKIERELAWRKQLLNDIRDEDNNNK